MIISPVFLSSRKGQILPVFNMVLNYGLGSGSSFDNIDFSEQILL